MLSAINLKIGTVYDFQYQPIMIGDVLDWWDTYETHEENYPVWFNTIIEMVELWKYKREPLYEQSIECIAYVYSLIS